ncbi:hypothetical protein [Polaromonas sp.]|jgi:hypothetical protein|uniref:hypothetical protein n=1 Tax=Polaromonas sp. TaxID=1869339 RepID=UPI001DF58418|nr:hypothetical protein [Polaromonas sp.]MBT9474813.1 hypothetical protein [Polaromonas sp.]
MPTAFHGACRLAFSVFLLDSQPSASQCPHLLIAPLAVGALPAAATKRIFLKLAVTTFNE